MALQIRHGTTGEWDLSSDKNNLKAGEPVFLIENPNEASVKDKLVIGKGVSSENNPIVSEFPNKKYVDDTFVAKSDAAATAPPADEGQGNAGSATTYARGDHKHPTDVSRAGKATIASDYDSTKTYNIGDVCYHENILYVAKEDSITGAWVDSKWDETTISEQLSSASKFSGTNKVVITDANGKETTSNVSSTELGYLSGATSYIQLQLDEKATVLDVGNKNNLNTSSKTNIVSAINEVNTNTITVDSHVGNLSSLETVSKTSTVSAINEVNTKTSTIDSHVGNLSSLETSSKTSAVSAINEIKDELDTVITSGTLDTETTLFTGPATQTYVDLSKDPSNFDFIDVYIKSDSNSTKSPVKSTFTGTDFKNSTSVASECNIEALIPGNSNPISFNTVRFTKASSGTNRYNIECYVWAWSGSSSASSALSQITTPASFGLVKIIGRMEVNGAELRGIRRGADGTNYPTAGDAVRGQISELKDALSELVDELEIDLPTVRASKQNITSNWTKLLEGLTILPNKTYTVKLTASQNVTSTVYIQLNNGSSFASHTMASGTSEVEYTFSVNEERENSDLEIYYNQAVITFTVELSHDPEPNRIDRIETSIDELEDSLNESLSLLIDTDAKTIAKNISPTIVTGKYVNLHGTVNENSGYYYFEVDNLNAGDVVVARSFYNNTSSIVIPYFRFVCAYDETGTPQSSKGSENVYGSYTVPSGISKIAVSIAYNYPLADGVLVFTSSDVADILNNKNVDSSLFGAFPQSATGSLNANDTLVVNANSVKKRKTILFKGNISTFSQIALGQGTDDLNSAKYVIDGNNVTFYRGTDAVGVAHAHGLTFKDYICVSVSVDNDHLPTITIMTNGGKFSVSEVTTWSGCMPNVYVTAGESTTLSDCKLTFVCEDIQKPLWIFGDSYVSYTSDRWTYHISKMGFNDYLLNGYSGEDSSHAMQNLRNLLEYGTPKYIIWALGMNDVDGVDAVNTLWKVAYDELIAICNENMITPILCTIPNVPTRNHTYKNQIIIDSGFEYIDFASAVGALNDTTWYDGMLSGDGVHPTEQGGIALASEVLKDFPYICN